MVTAVTIAAMRFTRITVLAVTSKETNLRMLNGVDIQPRQVWSLNMEKNEKLLLVSGTKSISLNIKSSVYDAVAERVNKQDTVKHWSWETYRGVTSIVIHFIDERTPLEILVDIENVGALKTAIEMIDAYFIVKAQRS